ncbi:MAG: helix-turn-helix transcriptional regulator [Alphaproteobacteria bacterium]
MTKYLNTMKAAEFLGISKSKLEKLRHFGGGAQYKKIGRRVVYSLADLELWANSNTFNSTSEYHKEGNHDALPQ